MSLRNIVRELIRDQMSSSSSSSSSLKSTTRATTTTSSVVVVEDEDGMLEQVLPAPPAPVQVSKWGELPSELMQDVLARVEADQDTWPGRRDVVACALVCKTWRRITKHIVNTPEDCGNITFPISIKQPGPRENPIQCFIKRERSTGIFRLYLGLTPALQGDNGKLLLSACKTKRGYGGFSISLALNDFSTSSTAFVGKVKTNFLGTRFTVFDSQPPCGNPAVISNSRTTRRLQSRQFPSTVPPGSHQVATVNYELNVLRTRGPRRMLCTLNSIPRSAVHVGGTAPTATGFLKSVDEKLSASSLSKPKETIIQSNSSSLTDAAEPVKLPLVLKNKAPRWHEQLQCWCLNFRGRVTVASVKNFQLVAAVDSAPPGELSPDPEPVLLQFGKIGKDIFTMDYRYPLSAFQAFGICLSSFDTKPACE